MAPSWVAFVLGFCMLVMACGRNEPYAGSLKLAGEPALHGFVKREGTGLVLNGESYRFSGANQYYFFYKNQRMVDDVIDSAKDLGLNALRVWAFCEGESHDGFCFQPQPGVYDEATFRNLDYAIYKAGQAGIRLVLVLANNWGGYDHFGGAQQYNQWAQVTEHEDFYADGTTRQFYRNYVAHMLNRSNSLTGATYKDDPTILMWELVNEPRAGNTDKLVSWMEEMSAYVKSIDSNHLVSAGTEGEYGNAAAFARINEIKNIDIVSLHLYPEIWNMSLDGARDYLERHIKNARDVSHKPDYECYTVYNAKLTGGSDSNPEVNRVIRESSRQFITGESVMGSHVFKP